VRVLITGGAGFVGSRLALAFRRDGAEVVAFDNLRRRGSETNLSALAEAGIAFVHGDVRSRGDLEDLPGVFDLMVEASAEPSVHAGADGSPGYVLETNLLGTLNCLELCRRRVGALVFLSTSRVYSIDAMRGLAVREDETRLVLEDAQPMPGASARGIAEDFPITGPRSFYGTSKLASEMVIEEYVATYGLKAVVDRCGVLAGAGQFAKPEQGVIALWAARHVYGTPLTYIGFGGEGRQVRDVLHPLDLYDLVRLQLERVEEHAGAVFNVGGGLEGSVSLRELTDICRDATGTEVPIASRPETAAVDVPVYVTDTARAEAAFGWAPRRGPRAIVDEIVEWIRADEAALRPILG
jgi:CDP-paratose 2-epimerase